MNHRFCYNNYLKSKKSRLFFKILVEFIYSEKATKFCQISTVDLYYVVTITYTVEISQNFVAFSEYMNFTYSLFMNIPFNFNSPSLIPTLYNHAHLLSHKDGIMQINNLNCALKRNPLSL